MVYYIFLKSLRSLEEFRENPHVKIPPKSPSTNFQSLGKFKNLIFIRKRIFPSLSAQSAQRPAGPPGLSAQPATDPSPFLPQAARACSAHPGLRGSGVLAKIRLPLYVGATRRRRLLLLSPPSGPHLSVPTPTSRRPTPATPPLLSATPLHPASTSRCRAKQLTSPP
jgi:hypothetical protein